MIRRAAAGLRPPRTPYVIPTEKRCTKCATLKPLFDFGLHKETRDGRNSWCRKCLGVLNLALVKANRCKVNAWKRADRAKKAATRPRRERPIHAAHVAAYLKEFARKHDAHVVAWRDTPAYRTAQKREWLAANPGVKRAKKAKRRAGKRQATPAWANPAAIQQWYFAATVAQRDTGSPWHVDHIVPLNSPLVCGLHCEANLQLLPGPLNEKKGNRHWPDMPQ